MVYLFIIVHRFHTCVDNVVHTDIAVIVGYIKISLFPEIFSPAVRTDKRPIPLKLHVKIFFWEIVVPAHDYRIVIGLFIANVAV